MFMKSTLAGFYATLLTLSAPLQWSTAERHRKLPSNIWNRILRRNYLTRQTGSRNAGDISWLQQKRALYQYNDPCETSETEIYTKDLDGTNYKEGQQYCPEKLKQVTCATGNSLNERGKTSCKIFTSGDCIDIVRYFKVTKYFPDSGTSDPNYEVKLKVGCACKQPKY